MSDLTDRITELLKSGVNYRMAKAVGSMPVVTGSPEAPISSTSAPRPKGVVVYWICAKGVTPANAKTADLIFNLAT